MAKTIFNASATLNDKSGLDNIVIKARPKFKGTKAEFKNCEFTDVVLPDEGSNLEKAIIGPNGWNNIFRLNIDDCDFGDNNKAYNAMELNVQLADGSTINNNNFGIVGTHNIINIYDVEDGATIDINDNVFAKAANGIRVGIRGDKSCTINIKRNRYESTDTGEYAGLLLIQPYGTATQSMGDVVINLDDTINNSGESQLWYYYAGSGDAQLDIEDRPKVYINGELQKYKDDPSLIIGPTAPESN